MPKQNSDILFYTLTPVRQAPDGTIMSAAIQQCMATGKTLAGMGGGGIALAPEIVEALDMRQHGEARAICSARDLEDLIALARRLADAGSTVEPDLIALAKGLVARIREEQI